MVFTNSKFSKGARGADDDVGDSVRRRLHHPVNTKLPINGNLHAKREVELDRSIQIQFTNTNEICVEVFEKTLHMVWLKKRRSLKPGSFNSYPPNAFADKFSANKVMAPPNPSLPPLPTQQTDAATSVLNIFADQQYFLDPCRTDSWWAARCTSLPNLWDRRLETWAMYTEHLHRGGRWEGESNEI